MSQADNCSTVAGSLRFERGKRLLNSADYHRVFKSNRKVGDKYWTILYCRNSHDIARLGMAVAKKRAKRAVDRNRLRRLVRESFRHQLLPPVDVVVLVKDPSVHASNEDLRNSLQRQWSSIAEKCES